MTEQIVRAAREAVAAAPPLGDDAYLRYARAVPDVLVRRWPDIEAANAADVAAGEARGFPPHMLARMRLTTADRDRFGRLAADVAGEIPRKLRPSDAVSGVGPIRAYRLPKPLGVLFMIYEARPEVTVEGALLAVCAGNAVVLRGGSEVAGTNQALGDALAEALVAAGLSPGMVHVLDDPDRRQLRELISREDAVDVVLPRGSPSLVDYCRRAAKVPVLASGGGVNHLYVHESADCDLAAVLAFDSKLPEPTGCTALEMLLVDDAAADRLLAAIAARAGAAGVPAFTLKVTDDVAARLPAGHGLTVAPLEPHDDGREFLDRTLGLRVVADLDAAVAHIRRYGSQHTEGIVCESPDAAQRFTRAVDAAAVVVNGSLRLNDGPTMGIGSEVAISTGRLHVRGPVTLEALVTYSWVVEGNGSVRDRPVPEPYPSATEEVGSDRQPVAPAAGDRVAAVLLEVKRVVIAESRLSLAPEDLPDDEPLNGGLLKVNSIGLLGMLMQLEEGLGVVLPDELFVGRRFDTVRDLAEVVLSADAAVGTGAA